MTPSRTSFDQAAYVAALNQSGKLEAFRDSPGAGAAMALSAAIFVAADLAMPEGAAFVLNSSTGKDSTVLLYAYFEAVYLWREAGHPIRPATVAVADTGSEFPEMQLRMIAEVAAINRHGQQGGLPLNAEIMRPPVKHRLLVEILGNGKPLPELTSPKGGGHKASSWCMDRVKAGSLRKIAERAKALHQNFVQALGVRHQESAARSASIDAYADGLPFGLTAMGSTPGKKDLLAIIPIVHWEVKWISDWIRAFKPVWRPEGREELRNIYLKGKAQLEDNTECAVTVSEEGTVSSSCSDLGGTRFGCWNCLLSQNKSLKNTSRSDDRYTWLRKFHTYLFRHHRRNFARVKRRQASRFTADTLFPKTFTFHERYWMLMLLLRAEQESGFTLLLDEEIAMIELLWRKHGVYTVTVADARLDAAAWRRTGKPLAFFDAPGTTDLLMQCSQSLGEGIPAGAFFQLELAAQAADGLKQGLDLTHLLFMAGTGLGTPLLPALLAYVIEDRRNPNHHIVMVTDTPSMPGTRTNSNLLNGKQMAAWQCLGVREPTDWERTMSDGRSFYYEVDLAKERAYIRDTAAAGGIDYAEFIPRISTYYENTRVVATQGAPEDAFAEEVYHWESIAWLQGRMTSDEFDELQYLVYQMTADSDYLNDGLAAASRSLLGSIRGQLDLLEDVTPTGREFRSKFNAAVKTGVNLLRWAPAFRSYIHGVKAVLRFCRDGRANPALIAKLTYAAQWHAVDPVEEAKLVNQITHNLALKPAALPIAA